MAQSGAFAAAIAELGTCTLLVRRDGPELRGFLLSPDVPSVDNAALILAQALAAHAEIDEWPTGLGECASFGVLEFVEDSTRAHEAQAGMDPANLPRIIASTLSDGDWVAVSLRAAKESERRRSSDWMKHRLGSAAPVHHSFAPEAFVMSMMGGASSPANTSGMLRTIAAAMPGFDLRVKAKSYSMIGSFLPAAVVAFLRTLVTITSLLGDPSVKLVPPVAALGAVVAAGLFAFGRLAGWLDSPYRRMLRQAQTGQFAAPRKRHLPPARPRKAVVIAGEQTKAERSGSYPLATTSFLVGPQVVTALVAPHAGAASGQATTSKRPTPGALLEPIGPRIGMTPEGPLYLSARDAMAGVACMGRAGSGKTQFVRSLFGWYCLERQNPKGLPGWPGRNNALIAFESKGESTEHYKAWAAATGDKVAVFNIADPDSWGIDLFHVEGLDAAQRANYITNMLKYAIREGGILDQSFETLEQVFTGAAGILSTAPKLSRENPTPTPTLTASMSDVNQQGSIVYFALALLGGFGPEIGSGLFEKIQT